MTEQAAGEVLSLPIFAELTRVELDRAIAAIRDFLGVESAAEDANRAA